MEPINRKTQLPYAAFYSGMFATLGVQLPFLSGWLHLKGFSAEDIGLLTGLALLARMTLGPLTALWADRQPDARTGLRIVAGLFALSAMTLNFPMPMVALGAAVIVLQWAFGVMAPLTDAAVMAEDRRGRLKFGVTRALGSSAFLVATLAGGEALTQLGLGATAALVSAAAGSTFAASFLLPRPLEPVRAGGGFADASRLLGAKPYLLAVASAAFTQGAHAVYYAFSILHWTSLGLSPRVVGALWGTGVVAEIILLMRMRKIVARLRPPILLAIGAAGAISRWFIIGLEPPLPVLFFAQGLHALSFAATFVGTVEFVKAAVPGRLANTAMTVNSSLGASAMTGLATFAAGPVFATAGGPAAYLAMSGMALVGLILALVLQRHWDGRKVFE